MSQKKDKHERLYEIIEERTARLKNPLDLAIEDEDAELAKEAKRLKLQQIIEERKKSIEELRRSRASGNPNPQTGLPMTTGSLASILLNSGASPEKVNEFLKKLDPQALGALIALSSNNPALAMMAFAMNQQRGEPMTVKDVVAISREMSRSGVQPNISIDVAKLVEAAKSQPQGMDTTKMVDSIINAIRTGMEIATKAKPETEKEEHWLTKLLSTPDGVKTAKEIGLFGGNQLEYAKLLKEMKESDRKFLREMKESDRRFQLLLKKMEEEKEQRKTKAMLEKRKTDMISGALTRVGKAIARGLSEAGEEGEEAAEGKTVSKVKKFRCEDCGAIISVPANIKKGSKVVCGKCGAEYRVD